MNIRIINLIAYFPLFMCMVSMAQIPKNLILTSIATANSPLAFVNPNDGSSDMFIVEQAGLIKILREGIVSEFLNISEKVETTNSDQGLLGLVFDPLYAKNGYFYVNYTRSGGSFGMGITVIERYQQSKQGEIDVNNSLVVLEIDQFYHNHNGGTMHFGFDSLLYIAMGDGGDREDPNNYSQNNNELLGKMLRINVNPDIIFKDSIDGLNKCGNISNYYIPIDNPFVHQTSDCGEIFMSGLRSPWKWSFDRETGDFFIGDVGQASFEEISFIDGNTAGGENLGWSCKEGHNVLIAERCPQDLSTLTDPIISYAHSIENTGNSIVGGYRYRGSAIPELIGTYIYTDTISGDVWFANLIEDQWQSTLWEQSLNFVVSFGEDSEGNLYTVSINGAIQKFTLKP